MIDELDAAELFAAMTDQDEPEDDAAVQRLDEACVERYGIELATLAAVATDLMKLCEHARLALSGQDARGFARDGAFICKVTSPAPGQQSGSPRPNPTCYLANP